jgi:hypothetical protein
MSSTTCKNCGEHHSIEEDNDVFGDEDDVYVTYTCPDGDTTYGAVINRSEITD